MSMTLRLSDNRVQSLRVDVLAKGPTFNSDGKITSEDTERVQENYMSVSIVFQQMAMMVLLMGLGFLLARKNIFSTEASSDFSKMIAEVCNPALLICSALDSDNTATEKDLLLAVLIAAIYYIVLVLISLRIPRLIGAKRGDGKFYQLLSTYGNIGFMGVPLISAVMGSTAVIYLSIFIVFFNLLVYTHGIQVVTSEHRKQKNKFEWKRMINPGMLASLLTVGIFLTRISVPVVVAESLQYVGKCATFLSMAVIGMVLAQIPFKELFSERRIYLFTAIRFLLLPCLVALVLKPFLQDRILLGVTVLSLALPAANMPLMLAQQYKTETDLLAKGIVLTTLLSVVTVTVASWVIAL